MPAEREAPEHDYWDTDSDLGASVTWHFVGADGLARLSGPSRFQADPPDGFSASLSRVQLDHVALEAFESTPHTAARTEPEIAAHPTRLLSFVLLVEGRARVQLADTAFELHAGQCFIADSRDTLISRTFTDTRMLRSAVGVEHVPEVLQRQGATSPGALRRTPLVDSYIAFVSSILTTAAAGRRASGGQLIAAVADLQSAVLAEAQELQLTRGGPAQLRQRMELFIEAGYRDPDLDPDAVARAFGISLRQAHAAFNDDEQTIARFIRDRRVAAAALELRAGTAPPRIAELAHRSGFRNPDTLSKAFQQRFAMTPSDYRDGGHRHLG